MDTGIFLIFDNKNIVSLWYYPRIRRSGFWSLFLSKKSATYTRVYSCLLILFASLNHHPKYLYSSVLSMIPSFTTSFISSIFPFPLFITIHFDFVLLNLNFLSSSNLLVFLITFSTVLQLLELIIYKCINYITLSTSYIFMF